MTTIRQYTQFDANELVDFQRYAFEDKRIADTRRTEWLFRRAPARRTRGSSLWIARLGGKIVGTYGGIPAQLKIGEDEASATWGVNVMVAPELRNTGLAYELAKAYRSLARVWLGLGFSKDGMRFAVKRGATALGSVPTYLCPVRLMLPLAQWRARGYVTERLEAFGWMVDKIWDEVSPHYPILARRDAEWLEWRFNGIHYPYHRFYVFGASSRPVGYFILRNTTWRGRRAFTIVDYLAAPKDLEGVLASAACTAHDLGASVVLCTTRNWALRPRRLGFMKTKRETLLMVNTAPDDPYRSTLDDPTNWFITEADGDAET